MYNYIIFFYTSIETYMIFYNSFDTLIKQHIILYRIYFIKYNIYIIYYMIYTYI